MSINLSALSKTFTICLLLFATNARADLRDFCGGRLLRNDVQRSSVPYEFSPGLTVKNLRADTRLFPRLGTRAELQDAFLAMRDAHVIPMDALEVRRRFPWLRFQNAGSGFARIPWSFCLNGCNLRAETGAAVLLEKGYVPPVAISLISDGQRLIRATDENEEAPASLYPSLHPQKMWIADPGRGLRARTEAWNWHVALGYVVGGELWILDPALRFEEPMRFEEWYERLAGGVEKIEIEVSWPFSLDDPSRVGLPLRLEEAIAPSLAERTGEDGGPRRKLGGTYARIQREILKAHAKRLIDEREFRELKALFWNVTGGLAPASD